MGARFRVTPRQKIYRSSFFISMRNYEWLVSKRYLWSKRRHPFVGVISTISVLGISVGVAALIVVLGVMNGFDEDLQNRIIGVRAHLVIEKDGVFDNAPVLIQKLSSHSSIQGASRFVEGQALLQKDEWGAGVLVRGVDLARERTVSKFFDYLTQGALSENPSGIVVGSELARRFHLRVGSEVRLLSQNSKKPSTFVVEGFFSSGMYDYDANLVFLNLAAAQALFEMGQGVSGVSLRLKDPQKAQSLKSQIQKSLQFPYYVRTWADMNKTLFGALKLEKIVMFLILALIILVACLNIAGSLTILVMDKTKDIGVLKSLGAPSRGLMKIFLLDGLLIGSVGAGTGLLAGLGISLALKNYSFIDLPKEIYYFDRLPVEINASDTLMVAGVAVVLSVLSALYPAWTAGKLDPVKALRYE
jgi:lipoprotein-releasing system permease protein